jgi:rRNA maturation RNase YbeY
MASKSKVYFFFDSVKANLRHRTRLKKAIENIFKLEKKSLKRLNYVFCSDQFLLSINRQYLKHDNYTDIIAFDLSENPGRINGEVYISVDRVKDNARVFGQSFKLELHRVIFHGALHLCGYRDKRMGDIRKMRRKEQNYLSKYLK